MTQQSNCMMNLVLSLALTKHFKNCAENSQLVRWQKAEQLNHIVAKCREHAHCDTCDTRFGIFRLHHLQHPIVASLCILVGVVMVLVLILILHVKRDVRAITSLHGEMRRNHRLNSWTMSCTELHNLNILGVCGSMALSMASTRPAELTELSVTSWDRNLASDTITLI